MRHQLQDERFQTGGAGQSPCAGATGESTLQSRLRYPLDWLRRETLHDCHSSRRCGTWRIGDRRPNRAGSRRAFRHLCRAASALAGAARHFICPAAQRVRLHHRALRQWQNYLAGHLCRSWNPDTGQVLLDGVGTTAAQRLGQSAYMHQRDLLLPWRSALDNAALGLEVQGTRKTAARSPARERFPAFGLSGFEGSLSRAAFGRHAATGRLSAHAAHRPIAFAAGRAVWRARCAHPRDQSGMVASRCWRKTRAACCW